MKKIALLALLPVLLSGCAIHQKVKPVERFSGSQICVVENTAVKDGFLDAYRKALTQKGYEVRVLAPSASLAACPVTSTYTANWRWDLATYMAYAEIKVYNQSKQSGEAVYDSMRGGANVGKFISAERKIAELVNQLFPGGAGT